MEQSRDRQGKFASKGEEKREVRTVRLTDSTWEKLGEVANKRCITRADLIEEMMSISDGFTESINIQQVVQALKDALKLKANSGGAIKKN